MRHPDSFCRPCCDNRVEIIPCTLKFYTSSACTFADFTVFSHTGRIKFPSELQHLLQGKMSLLLCSSKCATSLTHGFIIHVLSLRSHELIWEDIPGVLHHLYQFNPTLRSNQSVQVVTAKTHKQVTTASDNWTQDRCEVYPVSQVDIVRLRLKWELLYNTELERLYPSVTMIHIRQKRGRHLVLDHHSII